MLINTLKQFTTNERVETSNCFKADRTEASGDTTRHPSPAAPREQEDNFLRTSQYLGALGQVFAQAALIEFGTCLVA
ncbi:uncharacterized protein FSUBG_10462 [Fusarium subglutinans]|uniref:Uncharacterized protein n=1 Tax=Gibberella subglutinans TaxID=42677 RepID=A0A8H5P7J5_GIBSU|nr:uncharacterized protein FSUBG_10462 [Fusarium subglutinans]KAF5591536.1 hypothetical protein FSUBG_10462 [Fusarium subglutinans]